MTFFEHAQQAGGPAQTAPSGWIPLPFVDDSPDVHRVRADGSARPFRHVHSSGRKGSFAARSGLRRLLAERRLWSKTVIELDGWYPSNRITAGRVRFSWSIVAAAAGHMKRRDARCPRHIAHRV